MNWYLNVLKNYANFSGRARRQEYWMFILGNILFVVATLFIGNILNFIFELSAYIETCTLIIVVAYFIAILLPGLAVLVRRLHDVGKSGWMVLTGLIPLIGPIWILVLMLKDSKQGENVYGADPKRLERGAEKDKIKRASVYVIVASVFWMEAITYFGAIELLHAINNQFRPHTVRFIIGQLYIIIPVSLLILAAALLQKNNKL